MVPRQQARWIDFLLRTVSVIVIAELKMSIRVGKPLAILSFLGILLPQAALTATHRPATTLAYSSHYPKLLRSLNPGGQVEANLPGAASFSEEKDVVLPGPYRNLLPAQKHATLSNGRSCVVPAAGFVFVRNVSRNIFLSSLNL
jgi:hypothetical protein